MTPQPRAHAHNDYEHKRPLFDALDRGFCSVEADVYLVRGQLLVAHDRGQVRSERTLQALYLEPLCQRVLAHQGQVYPNGPGFTLLVDFKSDGEATYAALKDLLKPYSNMLTRFENDQIQTNAVTVIISGNRPKETMLADPIRYAALDGRLTDLQATWPPAFMPWISDNWRTHFRWGGTGPMPDPERHRLRDLTATIHQQGRRFRLWAIPDRAEVWRELLEAGVDLINTDRLEALEAFLTQTPASK